MRVKMPPFMRTGFQLSGHHSGLHNAPNFHDFVPALIL